MGRMFSATFEEIAVTAIQDLFEINAPSDAVVILHSVSISQSSDAGDAEAEMLNLLFHRGSTSGSGGSTVTSRPLNLGDGTFGGTVESNNTSQSTEGVQLRSESFNIFAGYMWQPPPEEYLIISPSDRLIIELQTAPSDSLTMSGTIVIEEVGG